MGLQDFIKTGRELLVHIMINLRADYTAFLQSTDPKVFGQASMSSTLLGILDEVRVYMYMHLNSTGNLKKKYRNLACAKLFW